MKTYTRLGAAASLLAVAAGTAAPAFAAGTPAGTSITNNVTVSFQVGGVAQNNVVASDSFTVDRRVDLVIAEEGNATTQVSPGAQSAVTTFIVTNNSNAPIDVNLAAANREGGTAEHGGVDNFNVSNIRIYLDSNNNSNFDPGTDQEITYLDQVGADANVRVFVVADIPLGLSTGQVAGVILTGTAHEADTAGSLGAVITQTAGANTAGVDTVFADSNANNNTPRDGIHFAEDDYTILAADLTATKTSRVISDPLNGTSDPKMIPGAVVEYCIAVANAPGSAEATNVTVTDTLPGQVTWVSSFGVLVGGTESGGICAADGANTGGESGGVVSGVIPSLPAGETRTVLFRVTIN